jgi:hypothetical protein
MIVTAFAWAAALAFVALVFFAGLPEYVAGLQGQAEERRAREARRRPKTGL